VGGESGNEHCFVQNASGVRKRCSGGDDFGRLVDGVGIDRDCNAERQRQRFSVQIRYLVLSFFFKKRRADCHKCSTFQRQCCTPGWQRHSVQVISKVLFDQGSGRHQSWEWLLLEVPICVWVGSELDEIGTSF
jgi:hypothetical protein